MTHRPSPDGTPPLSLKCRGCGHLLPVSAFYVKPQRPQHIRSHYSSRCKRCAIAAKQARYVENLAASRAAQRKYQQTYVARVRKEAQARLLMSKDAWAVPPFLAEKPSAETCPASDSLSTGARRDS